MDKQSFIEQTISGIRSKETKRAVALELTQHLEKNISYYMRQGLTEAEAEKEAIRQMGDPVKLSKKMKKVHKPKIEWGMIALFTTALCLGFFPLFALDQENPLFITKIVASLAGIVVLLVWMQFDYRKLHRYSWFFYCTATVALFLVFGEGLLSARMVNGTYYLSMGPFKGDSTIVLPFYFLAWASFLSGSSLKWWKTAILFILPLVLFLEALSLVNAMIYTSMVLVMYGWSIRKKPKALALLAGSLLLLAGGGGSVLWLTAKSYQLGRVPSFLYPEESYFYTQLKKIISEAGLFGKTIDPSQFHLSVPEAQTDMVLVTTIYGLGWLFFLFLLLILMAFSVRVLWLIGKIKDSFGQFLLVGCFVLYTLPLVLNTGMTLGLLPYMGIFVPFISYGTITILLYSFLTGVILSIYRLKDYPLKEKPVNE